MACCGQLYILCGPDFTVGICVSAVDSFSLVSTQETISMVLDVIKQRHCPLSVILLKVNFQQKQMIFFTLQE